MLASIMKIFGQSGFLQLALPGARRAAHDDGRVLDLFRNRAELKKAYSAMQDELLQLKDRVKQQEGATARVQEMLQGLELRLAKPASGYAAMVFYQLRDLWGVGRQLLDEFISELATQREDHERKQFLAEHNRQQFARRQGVAAALHGATEAVESAHEHAGRLRQQLLQHGSWWHYFKRRALHQQIQAAGMKLLLADRELSAARAAHEAALAEPEPQFPGVSVVARRAINMAAIAYGQLLCERLARHRLLEPTRDASARREPPAEQYGDQARCERLMAEIERARQALQQRASLQQEIRIAVEQLRPRARYRNDGDTLPVAESLAPEPGAGGTSVLIDDAWEIHRLLLR